MKILGGMMAYGGIMRLRLRLCGGVLATALLVPGCSGNGDDTGGGGGAAPQSPAAPESTAAPEGVGGLPSGEPTFTPDPDRVPASRPEALELARKVVAKPENWGAGYVRSSPYKSGPDRASELGEDCVWTRRPLRSSELVSVTRRSELPGGDGNGPLRVAAVVTVHRDARSASWEMARTLEEALRCPDQQLNSDERITGLQSVGDPTHGRHDTGDDMVLESGSINSGLPGGSHAYTWAQNRLGSITVGVAVKGSEGHDEAEVQQTASKGVAYMLTKAELELGAGK